MSSAIILFIFGFILLLKGADILTDAAAEIAKELKISNFIVGVVVIGFGTSIPELIITVLSNIKEAEPVGIGTIVGSNTFNLLFILGVAALIAPISLSKGKIWKHLPWNLGAVILVGLLLVPGLGYLELSRLEGLLLLGVFFVWLGYLRAVNKGIPEDRPENRGKTRPRFENAALIIAGLIGIIVGGSWVTEGAVRFAAWAGIGEATIGLTIVAIGTSLPELFASAVAAWKRNIGIAVGNVIGSNIFDFLMIFGVASAMKPIRFTPLLSMDLWMTALASALLFVALAIGKKQTLGKTWGVCFILLYGAYLAYIFLLRSS
ncbi:MAG: calcium/sodium antiporter [bacterium]|nr:calcium/sodium antiporter [bacterium]